MPALPALVLALAAGEADASRRALRIDFGGEWTTEALGTPQCAGTSATDTLVDFGGFVFSGREDAAYLADAYCQLSVDGVFSGSSFFDEPGLQALIGDNTDNAVTAIRYAYLDADRFGAPAPEGFQWGFYFFPDGLTVVGLYGLVDVALTATSYITQGATLRWNGTMGHDGEYFCIQDGAWLGTWDGTLADAGSACLLALQRVFGDGFE
jgi:hypothetical protein